MPGGDCYIGPSVFDHVLPTMRVCQEEIFGPVLSIIRAGSLDDAIDSLNSTDFGNMGVIFTSSGHSAHRFKTQAKVGMIDAPEFSRPAILSACRESPFMDFPHYARCGSLTSRATI